MNERIKQLRKKLKLTQEDFGKRIGVAGSTVCKLEINGHNVSNSIIVSICREFNVSEEWLRTGEGEMFARTVSGMLDAMAERHRLSPAGRAFVESYICAEPSIQDAVVDFVKSAASSLEQARNSSADDDE